jgi:formate hydrogenlyase transcriptional activator
MKKPVEVIPSHVQQALIQYHWPGNIRELQNVIERAVMLSRGFALEVQLSDLKPAVKDATLAGAEREYIIRVLSENNWVVSGKNGAASRLGLNRSTLQSKIRKLRISRPM